MSRHPPGGTQTDRATSAIGTAPRGQIRSARWAERTCPRRPGAFSKLGAAVRNAAAEKKAAKAGAHPEAGRGRAGRRGARHQWGLRHFNRRDLREWLRSRRAKWAEGHSGTGPKTTDKNTPYERLRSIKFTQAVDQSSGATSALESAVGPAVAKLMKGGKGLMKASAPGMAAAGFAHLASNAARKSFLTVATDQQIHTLTNQSSNSVGLKTSNKGHDEIGRALETAGKAVLGVVEADPQAAAAPANAADPAPHHQRVSPLRRPP